MEFAIAKETFLKALQNVQGIVENRKTMPILSNVLISAQPEKIEIIATDLEVGMKSSYPGRCSYKQEKLLFRPKNSMKSSRNCRRKRFTFPHGKTTG